MEMFFELECPHCGHGLRIPVKYLGKHGQCVKCHGAVETSVNMRLKGAGTLLHNAVQKGDPNLVEFLLTQGADPNAKDDAGITPLDAANVFHQNAIASMLIEKGASEAPPASATEKNGNRQQSPMRIGGNAAVRAFRHPIGSVASWLRATESTSVETFDLYFKIAAWVAGGGLLLLALSPFFKWITVGNGGFTGIAGDGKIVFGLTVPAIVVYLAAMFMGKWITPVFLGVQAWGTLAVFWMVAVLSKFGYVLDSPNMKDNPFAALFATQVGPGAGLYLGLIGGIGIAGALGFILVRRLRAAGNLKPYYATQGLSCVLGILLVFIHGLDQSTRESAALATLTTDSGTPSASSSPSSDWVSAEFAVKQGDVQIQLSSAYVGTVPAQEKRGNQDVSSSETYLAIGVTLINNSSTQKLNYETWAGERVSFERDYASVEDNFGNIYRRIDFGIFNEPVGRVESDSLYPGASINDVLIFEKPVKNVEYLRLELPAKNFGESGMIRFQVPASMISNFSPQ